MEVWSRERARAEVYWRQGLTERLPTASDALAHLGVIQTQYVASLARAVIARSHQYPRGWDARALAEGGEAVRCWSLRSTVHAHSRPGHGLVLGALNSPDREKWDRWRAELGLPVDIDDQIHRVLCKGPLTRKELHGAVPALASLPWTGWGSDCRPLALQGRLAMVGMGAEQRFAALAEKVTARPLVDLFREYLRLHAPASVDDFTYWAGLRKSAVRTLTREIAPETRIVHLEGRELLVPQDTAEERPVLEGVRLLAKFDPLTMAHRDKTSYLPLVDRPKVFRIAAQVEAAVLTPDGMVGTWRLERKGKALSVRFEPFQGTRIPKSWTREAERLVSALS